MKVILLLAFTLPTLTFAQVKVDGTDINQLPEVKYVELLGVQKAFSTKVTVIIDFGQKMSFGSDQRIEGPDGKAIVFNSMVEALNFMCKNGYEFINNYVVTIGQSQNIYHYLLRRREALAVTGG